MQNATHTANPDASKTQQLNANATQPQTKTETKAIVNANLLVQFILLAENTRALQL
jgi:hypothetical protein